MWTHFRSMYIYSNITDENPIMGSVCKMFDLDDTIITTKSGKKFPIDYDDWEILNHPNTDDLVIFTNQAKVDIYGYKLKIENIITAMNIKRYIVVVLNSKTDKYYIANGSRIQLRKPDQHCFNYVRNGFLKKINKFVYVGDAAGRLGDFSNSDLMFAKNIKSTGVNIDFLTPEEYFLNKKYGTYPDEIVAAEVSKCLFRSDVKIVLLSGFPCSGKSYIAKLFESDGWKVVSKDIMKKKCDHAFMTLLESGYKVVVDNTNLTIDDRNKWKFKDYKRACVIIKTSVENCSENEILRTMEKPDHKSLSPIVYAKMRKIFEKVGEDEFEKVYRL